MGITDFCTDPEVALDYAHLEVGNATLAIVRLKEKEPRLGTIH